MYDTYVVARFNPDTWRARAAIRLQRSAAKPGAETSYERDLVAITSIEKVVNWCGSKKFSVVFRRRSGGIYDPGTKTIEISGRSSPEKQLHMLLHECGHHLIGNPQADERFSRGYSNDDPNSTRTTAYRVDVVAEELEAWHRGQRLAARLKIKLNKVAYHEARTAGIRSYMKWCAQPGEYSLLKD